MKGLNQKTWTIRVIGAELQWHMSWQQSKDICYLTANTKLADYSKAVRVASEGLAREFREAVMETMRKRHGDEVELVVEQGGHKKTLDDEVVAARIAQKNFAPNKRPRLQGEASTKGWGVARFYGMGSMEYHLETGLWLPDKQLYDGAPIRLFESMVVADEFARSLPQEGQPHGVQFLLHGKGKVQTWSSHKMSLSRNVTGSKKTQKP